MCLATIAEYAQNVNKKEQKFYSFLCRIETHALREHGMRRHGLRYPRIAAYRAPLPDDGGSPQNGGVGINRHIIFYSRVPLFVHKLFLYAQRAERYALINLHIIADDAGFPHDNARSVVNEKAFPNFRAGIDVYARAAVRVFGHHAGDDGHPAFKEEMRHAVDVYCLYAGIRDGDLLRRAGGGVSVVRRLYVKPHLAADFGNFLYERAARLFRKHKAVARLHAFILHHVDERLFDFPREHGDDAVHGLPRHKAQGGAVHRLRAVGAREKKPLYVRKYVDDVLPARKIVRLFQIDAAILVIRRKYSLNRFIYGHAVIIAEIPTSIKEIKKAFPLTENAFFGLCHVTALTLPASQSQPASLASSVCQLAKLSLPTCQTSVTNLSRTDRQAVAIICDTHPFAQE